MVRTKDPATRGRRPARRGARRHQINTAQALPAKAATSSPQYEIDNTQQNRSKTCSARHQAPEQLRAPQLSDSSSPTLTMQIAKNLPIKTPIMTMLNHQFISNTYNWRLRLSGVIESEILCFFRFPRLLPVRENERFCSR